MERDKRSGIQGLGVNRKGWVYEGVQLIGVIMMVKKKTWWLGWW